MTRQEFIRNVTTWSQLLDFCFMLDCDVCASIIPHEDLREYIAEDFNEYAYEYYWTDIRDWLNSIDNNASFYYRDGSFDYTSVDDEFDAYKQEVLDWCDEAYDVFDEDLEAERPIPNTFSIDLDTDLLATSRMRTDDEPGITESDFSIDELLGFGSSTPIT